MIRLSDASCRPDGVVVAREDASVVIVDLKHMGVHHDGSIALEPIDTAISDVGDRAEKHAKGAPANVPIDTAMSDVADRAEKHAKGAPADAVVLEEVEARTEEQVELSGALLLFMAPAALIAAVGV